MLVIRLQILIIARSRHISVISRDITFILQSQASYNARLIVVLIRNTNLVNLFLDQVCIRQYSLAGSRQFTFSLLALRQLDLLDFIIKLLEYYLYFLSICVYVATLYKFKYFGFARYQLPLLSRLDLLPCRYYLASFLLLGYYLVCQSLRQRVLQSSLMPSQTLVDYQRR